MISTPYDWPQLLAAINDLVIVLDTRNHIVDFNHAAQEACGLSAHSIGAAPDTMSPAWADLFQRNLGVSSGKETVTLEVGESRRIYDLTISPIQDTRRYMVGRLFLLHDISELKQAQAALQFSEEKFSKAFHHSFDAILISRLADGRIIEVNQGFCRLTGYSRQEALSSSTLALGLWADPQDRKRVTAALQENKSIQGYEYDFRIKSGERRNCLYSSEIIDLGGETHVLSVVRDITERERTENIIRLRLRLFEFAVDHSVGELMQKALDEIGQVTSSPIGFYHFVEADQKTLSLQAWSTRTIQEFCQAEGKELHYSLDQAGVWVDCVYQRKPIIHNDYESLPHRKGMPVGHAPVKRELLVPIMRDGRIVSILGIGNKPTDYEEKDADLVAYVADIVWSIVERKQAEQQLQEYQRRLEAQNLELRKLSLAIEQSGSTIVITDTNGNIQYANPRFEETTGYTLQQALGQNPRLLKSGKQSADYYRDLWETISGGQTWCGEFSNRRKDGTLYWESATISPVHDDHGQITNYIAVKEDISERKQAQEALSQYAEQLAAQNAELDAFAHTVAHDLKSPLGVIMGFAELLFKDRENMSPGEISEALRIIVQTGDKTNTIIEELMLLAGVRKQEIIPEPLDMGSSVRAAIERSQMFIQGRHAQITLLDEAAWPVALGHAPWVEEVWINYLSNAIKYGGRPPEIQVGATIQADGQARFWVCDNGPGLSAEAQSSLFAPFTRLDQVRAKGHGLGLSIVRRIVEKLGGTVGVESEVGQGSVFYFTLPLTSA